MIAALCRPDAMLAVELAPRRVAALDVYLDALGLQGNVTAAYGTDQADGEQIGGLLQSTFGGAPVDMVIDDASHDLDLSRRSFDILFPTLREGGLYILEDWPWAHLGNEIRRPRDQPLTTLVFEFTMALPSTPGLIDEIVITRDWVSVRRGPSQMAAPFQISNSYGKRGRALLANAPLLPDAS